MAWDSKPYPLVTTSSTELGPSKLEVAGMAQPSVGKFCRYAFTIGFSYFGFQRVVSAMKPKIFSPLTTGGKYRGHILQPPAHRGTTMEGRARFCGADTNRAWFCGTAIGHEEKSTMSFRGLRPLDPHRDSAPGPHLGP
ncbi:hypothetical protein HOLleu_21056 [Holothuria leucospilota]|uniref:Uncharacterized protein n=1 Tax=Holothuria leucospilota TaxID=206669 RepID=A0A9Q1BWQ7_HOLLE|nr:hypothetical protein HOLleu_21056 [Holothuria leucospilota]